MINPSKFSFPFLSDLDSTTYLQSLLQDHWNIKNSDIEAEIIAQFIISNIQGKNPARIIWEGFDPIGKKLLEKIRSIIPSLQVIGYLNHVRHKDVDKKKSHAFITIPELPHIRFDFIILADTSLSQKSKSVILQQGIPRKKIRVAFNNAHIPSRFKEVNEKKIGHFLTSISKERGKRKILFFIVMQGGSCPSVEFLVQSLKGNSQITTCAAYIFTEPPKNTFDYSISCDGSFQLLAKLLKSIPNHLIYIQSHFKWAFLSQFVYAINPDNHIVHEVNDWMGSFIDNPKSAMISEKEGLWSCKEIETILRNEDFLSNHISGFIYKNGGKWMEEKVAHSKIPSLQLLPCQPRKMMRQPQIRKNNGTWDLVYAGKVVPTKSSSSFFGDNKLLPLVKELTKQKLNTTIWNSPIFNEAQLKINFEDYYKESIRNSYFRFNQGTSIENIVDEMNGNYDFGLILYHFNPGLKVGKHHLAGSMATKIFTYIAAGLPILISPELKSMADFVSKNKIGLVIKRKNICSLKRILDKCDYASLSNNVANAQKKYCAENNIDQLLSFFNSIT